MIVQIGRPNIACHSEHSEESAFEQRKTDSSAFGFGMTILGIVFL
jgi:hypothetical protein